MTSTPKLLLAALAGLALAGCAVEAQPRGQAGVARAERPNILFILVDDLGYADFSVTGNKRVSTPNIDRLAAEGLLMEQFTVAAPICSPSRAAFMTGRFPAELGFVSYIDSRRRNREMAQADWLDPKLPTMPAALRRVGYATGHFGKWHLGGGRDIGDAPLPTAYGFDESFTQFEGLGPRVLLTENTANFSTQSTALGQGPITRAPKAALTGMYVDRTLDFVSRNRRQPWFAQLWLDDVHDPWHPSAEQLAAVRGKGRTEAEKRFFAVLVGMDAQIGRLVEGLRRRGELDGTLIVLTGDNGPVASPQYYRGGAEPPGDTGGLRGRKGSLYEGGVREPLIVRWPGRVPAGRRSGATAANAVDLFPTLAQITGAATPTGADGVSLAQAWRGAPIASRPDLYYAYGGFGVQGKSPQVHLARDRSPPFAIRSGDWKLLARGDGAEPELYNIAEDPDESDNLAGQRADIVRALTPKLVAWRRSLPQ